MLVIALSASMIVSMAMLAMADTVDNAVAVSGQTEESADAAEDDILESDAVNVDTYLSTSNHYALEGMQWAINRVSESWCQDMDGAYGLRQYCF